jgi:hypothetical protein
MNSKWVVVLLVLIAPATARAQERPIDSPLETFLVTKIRRAAEARLYSAVWGEASLPSR